MFLTKDELQALTGGVQTAKMIQWLKDEGFLFRVGLDGLPVVLREHVRAAMGNPGKANKLDIDLTWMKPNGKTAQHQKRPA